MKKSQKLIQRLKTELEFDIPDGTVIRRTYAGTHQRSAGAWSWFLHHADPMKAALVDIGSAESITFLLKAKTLTTYRVPHGGTEICGEYQK